MNTSTLVIPTTDITLFLELGTKIRQRHSFNAIPWYVDTSLNHFIETTDCQVKLFVTTDTNMGRVAAITFDHSDTGIIGWYECDFIEATSNALLDAAVNFLKDKGCKQIIGPMNGTTWNNYRFNCTTEKPLLPGDPYQPNYYIEFWKKYGFDPIYQYESHIAPTDLIAPLTMKQAKELARQNGLKVSLYPTTVSEEFMQRMYNFYHACFQSNPLFAPASFERFKQLSEGLMQIFDPAHSLLVTDNNENPVAVTISYKDYYHHLYQQKQLTDPEYAQPKLLIKTIATHPDWQGNKIGSLMIALVYQLARTSGFEKAYHLLMHQGNLSATKGKEKFTTEKIREYAMYALNLT